MKLKKFKERDNKRIGVVVFTLVCLFLVSGAIFYRTFAIFEVKTNQNVIKGQVQTGDILFAFYYENDDGEYVITDQIPDGDYVLSTSQSYCGFAGQNDENIKLSMSSDKTLEIEGLSRTSTKCKLYFEKNKNPFANPKEIIDEATGNGLYKVNHNEDTDTTLGEEWKEHPEYRYAGPDPNNYLWFNSDQGCTEEGDSDGKHCELWRIIGLVNVKTTSGIIEQRVKIIRNESLGPYSWDYGVDGQYENDWTQATLMEMLNDIYYESHSGSCYQGSRMAEKCDFTSIGLKESARDMIDKDIIWNIGGWKDSKVTTSVMYGYERGETVYDSRPTTWKYSNTKKLSPETDSLFHSVGLMYPSDYGYAVGGTKENRNTCLAKNLYEYNSVGCYDNNWLSGSTDWFLSPWSLGSNRAFHLDSDGFAESDFGYSSHAVRSVVYLSDKVSISGGQGTVDVPFELSVQ